MTAARPLKVGLVQMAMSAEPEDNLARAMAHVRDAAQRGAVLVVLPELFRSRYFCQSEDAAQFALAEAIPGPSTEALAKLAGTVWDQINTKGTETMKAAGVQITTADAAFMADLHKLLDPIEANWLKDAEKKGVDGKAALAFFKAEIKKVNAGMKK